MGAAAPVVKKINTIFIAPCKHKCKHIVLHFLGNGVWTRTQIWIGGIEPGPALRPSPFRVPLLKPGMVWLHGMRVC